MGLALAQATAAAGAASPGPRPGSRAEAVDPGRAAAPGPGPGRAWALGVGVVGYFGVFHLFQNVFENVKSGLSKCQNVKKPGVQNAKFGCLEMQKCQESGFWEMHKILDFREIQVFKVSGFPKGRKMANITCSFWEGSLELPPQTYPNYLAEGSSECPPLLNSFSGGTLEP